MIKLHNVCSGYNNKEIIHNITFELKEDQNLSIIGPNACGKTTLLRCIAGILPFSGDIFLNNQNIKYIKRKHFSKKIAMLSQMSNIYFNYTVFEIVMMGRFVYKTGNLFDRESDLDKMAVLSALETVDMIKFKDSDVEKLSGGQLQRVFLAKALAQDPEIILLDEPTNHLDLSYQVDLIKFFKNWSKTQGKMVIGVLHDINLAMLLTDNVLLMEDGHIKAFGKNDEVYTSDVLAATYKMDVIGYMFEVFKNWKKITNNKI